jgi:3-phenylpropionate/cinnamic acid dioxygenase small subunit
MREARVKRLKSGYSMSATAAARTVRSSSRFRLLSADAHGCELRCAQHLVEHKFGATRMLAADVSYRLVINPAGGLLLDEKVVRLINADEALHGIGYLL